MPWSARRSPSGDRGMEAARTLELVRVKLDQRIGTELGGYRILGQLGRGAVKPANILVGPEDRAYRSDFGAVKELSSAGMTRTGAFVGTIEYCAPEQIEGGEVDARTDVYALACVLYETLTGTPPFHRPSEVAVLNAHLHAQPPRLTKVAPGLPSELEHVISKALSKSPL